MSATCILQRFKVDLLGLVISLAYVCILPRLERSNSEPKSVSVQPATPIIGLNIMMALINIYSLQQQAVDLGIYPTGNVQRAHTRYDDMTHPLGNSCDG